MLICIWIMRTGPFAFRDYWRISDRQRARDWIETLALNGGMWPCFDLVVTSDHAPPESFLDHSAVKSRTRRSDAVTAALAAPPGIWLESRQC
jgi:hypothetical protein